MRQVLEFNTRWAFSKEVSVFLKNISEKTFLTKTTWQRPLDKEITYKFTQSKSDLI